MAAPRLFINEHPMTGYSGFGALIRDGDDNRHWIIKLILVELLRKNKANPIQPK